MKKEQSLFCPGSAEKIPSLGKHLVVAIDLGFSKSRSSCGVAWQDGTCSKMRVENFMFGEALEKVREIISEHKEKESILIIEAPLSGVFSRSGNPVERGYFEKRNRNQAVSANRYWYSGPGAATCLAAVFFLRELSAVLSQKCRKVYLYEGFLTGEQKTGNHSKHSEDAKRLLECFFDDNRQVEKVSIPEGGRAITILDVICAKGQPPAIICPQQEQ